MGIFTTLTGERKAAFFRKQYQRGKYSLAVLEEHGISPEAPAVVASKRASPPPLLTPADLPCIHRGDYIETVGCKPCQSRGKSGAEVYQCSLFGRCWMHNFTPKRGSETAVACATCDSRQPDPKLAD